MTKDRFAKFRQDVVDTVRLLYPTVPEDVLEKIEVSPSRDAKHGDANTNAAFVISRLVGEKPQGVSASLRVNFVNPDNYARLEPAGAGFLNAAFKDDENRDLVHIVLRAGEAFG